jgi:hypothetical protein
VNTSNWQNNLLQLTVEPSTGLDMAPGQTPASRVYGARVAPAQAVGTLLFWGMANASNPSVAGNITGDIYVVTNHGGVVSFPVLGRAVDPGAPGDAPQAAGIRFARRMPAER